MDQLATRILNQFTGLARYNFKCLLYYAKYTIIGTKVSSLSTLNGAWFKQLKRLSSRILVFEPLGVILFVVYRAKSSSSYSHLVYPQNADFLNVASSSHKYRYFKPIVRRYFMENLPCLILLQMHIPWCTSKHMFFPFNDQILHTNYLWIRWSLRHSHIVSNVAPLVIVLLQQHTLPYRFILHIVSSLLLH